MSEEQMALAPPAPARPGRKRGASRQRTQGRVGPQMTLDQAIEAARVGARLQDLARACGVLDAADPALTVELRLAGLFEPALVCTAGEALAMLRGEAGALRQRLVALGVRVPT